MGIDSCSGHPAGPTYFSPRPAMGGSPDVKCNGIAVVRINDAWGLHTNILSVHEGLGIGGSATVFCNGLALMRINDMIDCGSTCAAGSPDAFSG